MTTSSHTEGATGPRPAHTYDQSEVERFSRIASEWWDPHGKFRPLHKLGPARLAFIRDALLRHFERPSGGLKSLAGLRLLDIGCGGGLICEPLARLGAMVTGLDPSPENIAAARAHAEGGGLSIDYQAARVEDLAGEGAGFDAVLCLEVVEHVPDPQAFIAECARLVRPGGLMVLSTMNRTIKSYALAIVAAEYVLGWLPRGTHQWERFVTPDELDRFVRAAGLGPSRFEGLVFDPFRDEWRLSPDTDVNYMASAARPVPPAAA